MIPIVKLLTLNKVLCTTNYEYMLITNRLITEMVGWMELVTWENSSPCDGESIAIQTEVRH